MPGDEIGKIREGLEIDYILADGVDVISESMSGAVRVSRIVQDLRSFSRVDAPETEVPDISLHNLMHIRTDSRYYAPSRRKCEVPMHELSITQSMVELCERNAAGRRVISVTMEIGELSGVVLDAVEFCFDACSRDTLLEGALLIMERIPGRGRCCCGAESPISSYFDPCSSCGGFGLTVTAGEELRVRELEVE